MEKMFGKMMEGCMKGISADDRKKMLEKMATMCPCAGKNLSEDDRKALKENVLAFCGSMKEKMSACLKKTGSQTGSQTCAPEKA